jgi:hypothetical protein
MTKKERIYLKYDGKCAYSGTPLEPDWQMDHIVPVKILNNFDMNINDINNIVPCQKIINHYKRSLTLEQFRVLWLGKLHERLKKIPINPRTEKSKNKIKYILKVASYFGITKDKPFSGKFYFEE